MKNQVVNLRKSGLLNTSMARVEDSYLFCRRDFLRALGGIGLLALTRSDAWTGSMETSDSLSSFISFDREIQKFMQARNIPGAALAVVKDQRLVCARGYGWVDRESKIPVKPASLFRIASITKPFTAVAVLKLIEERKLGLEARAFDVLASGPDALHANGAKFDERWKLITIRQLLQHTGGWDRDKSFDPMFRSRQIAKELGIASPPGPRDIIRYMFGRPLDFDPGARYAYSNFGYSVLGRVIEKIAGMSYGKFVQDNVLAPIGIKRMRIGASLEGKRAEGEVRYYMPREETADSVFDSPANASFERRGHAAGGSDAAARRVQEDSRRSETAAVLSSVVSSAKDSVGEPPTDVREQRAFPGRVPWPYGGFCLESMDAHGGWIASAVDLARFAAALHDAEHSPLLKPETIQTMHRPPDPPVSRNDDGSLKDHYYGCGWLVRPVGKEANYWHTGSLPGTYTLLVRRHEGVSWAILFNQRSDDKKLPDSEIDPALHRAAKAVTDWPKHDLFKQFKSRL